MVRAAPRLATIAALVAITSGCDTLGQSEPVPTPTADGRVLPSGDPDTVVVSTASLPLSAAVHVHALAVDPAGRLLAATHAGLYHVGLAGGMTPIGTSRDDLTALTVTDDGTLLASGHQAGGAAAGEALGVIRSTDEGRTWHTWATPAPADFHSLASRGETVVASDGTTAHISEDGGRTWSAGRRGPVRSVAVDTSTVWAAGPGGLQRSGDRGRSFQAVPSAPDLLLLAVAPDTTPWAMSRDGELWVWSEDAGWTPVTRLGTVNALAAADERNAYAVAGTRLISIRRTWTSANR